MWTYSYNSPVIFKDCTGFVAVITITAGVSISLSAAIAFLAKTILVFAVLAVLLDKNFWKTLSKAITNVWKYAVNTVGYLTTAISEVIEATKKARKYSGNEDHHIVAQKDGRAELSRILLKKYELDPSQKYNIVTIKKTLHKHLHTSAYHYGVYLVLKGLESRGKNKKQRKAYILSGLIIIGTLLKAASNAVR